MRISSTYTKKLERSLWKCGISSTEAVVILH